MVQTLYGLGGVGKTQLALEYAHRFAAYYDLIWWIDAEQPVLIPEQLARLAERLGLPLGPAVADTVGRLLAELRDRDRWLLILDNAERPADLAAYRPGGAGHVLITSRSPRWGALSGRLEVNVLARGDDRAPTSLHPGPERGARRRTRRSAAGRRPGRRLPGTDRIATRRLPAPLPHPTAPACWPAAT